jgi:hypothetical protein
MPDRFTISSSFFGTASWNNPSIWYEGIVPTSSDDVWIRGIRTTVSANTPFWPGTASEFFVASNIGFPSGGAQLYTYTDRNQEVRLNYQGISGSNRLLGVSVDQAYSAPWGQQPSYPNQPLFDFPDKRSGVIPAGALIQFRPGVIALSGSSSAISKILTIENGGEFALSGTSSYFIRNGININDGTLRAQDSASFVFFNLFSGSRFISTGNISTPESASYISMNDFPFSRLIMEGPEVRTNTVLTNSASVGDTFLSVQNASNFEFGDWIFVGEDQIGYERQDDANNFTGLFTTVYSQYRTSEDETFYVLGKDTGSIPNKLYIQRMNGLEGKILATASSTEIIVDEERFKVGDKILINNQERIIIEVTSSYDYLLRDYDFTSPSASAFLSDWELDPTRSPAFMNWNLAPGKGLTLQANEAINQYRATVIKNIFRDNVKVEAWVKNDSFNLSGSLTSPAFRDNINSYGVILHAEPTNDFDERQINGLGSGQYYKTAAFINPFQSSFMVINKGEPNYSDKYKPFLAGITNIEEERKITLEHSRGFVKAYLDDVCYYESIDKWGATAGRLGIATQNFKVVYTRFKVYAKCQKIVLDSPITGLTSNDIVYESGVESPHDINNQVIKLSSVILDPGAHKNLAFAYRGAENNENNGIWPYIYSINTRPTQEFVQTGTGGRSVFGAPLVDGVLNGFNVGTGAGGTLTGSSVILDLITPVSFSNFGFNEQFTAIMQNFTSSISGGLSISASNDLYTWVPLSGGIDRRARVNEQSIRDWDLGGTHVYRYIRLQNNGATFTGLGLTNTNYLNISVRSGSLNQIILNNTSDFNVGDQIVLTPRTAIGRMNSDPSTFDLLWNTLVSGSDLPLLDGTYASYFTITGKSGSVLTLDRKVNFIIQKGTQVFKINKKLNFSGSLTPGTIGTGRIRGSIGTTFQAKSVFKNVGFQYLTDNYYYFGGTPGRTWGAFTYTYTNAWEPAILKGCSFYNCYSSSYNWQGGSSTQKSNYQLRHNVFADAGWFPPSQHTTTIQLPYIMTGNTFIGMADASITMGTYSNASHNFFYCTNAFFGWGTFFQTNFRTTIGMYYKHNRNLYLGGGQLMNFGIPYNFIPDMLLRFEFKDNKIEFATVGRTSGGTINYSAYPTFPIERMLLSNRLSYDANRFSNNNNYGLLNVGGGSLNVGSYSSPVKDYNRYGYDVVTNNQGWIIKEPNNEWYKFYHFSGSVQLGRMDQPFSNTYYWKNAMITAQVAIEDNTTASFTVGFDYYHDMSQWIQTEGGFAYDLANAPNINYNVYVFTGSAPEYVYRNPIFIPVSSSYVGGLCTYLYKNGKLVSPLNRIQKSLTPQHYEVTYQLEGQGVYAICLAQDITAAGYVALKNITSRLIAPQTSSVFVLNNYFDMRFLDGALTTQFRNANNQYPQTNPKFRLKGAKLF